MLSFHRVVPLYTYLLVCSFINLAPPLWVTLLVCSFACVPYSKNYKSDIGHVITQGEALPVDRSSTKLILDSDQDYEFVCCSGIFGG